MAASTSAEPAPVSIRVLLADDQALIRTAFKMMLNAVDDIEVVAEAANGAEAVTQAARYTPDVVVMDVRMPGLDGIEATRQVVAQTPSRVLILTTFDLDEYAFDGLQAGASGFLLKDALPETLCAAIRAVASGDAVVTPRITKNLIARYTRSQRVGRASSQTDPLLGLTPREREVFALVADGLSNAEIAERLYLTEATVKTHLTRMFVKVGVRDRVQLVIFAYEQGLR